MVKKVRGLRLIFLVAILLGIYLISSLAASVHASPVAETATMSIVNEIPNFVATGTSGAYNLKVTSKGGSLSAGYSAMTLTPWGYVTAKWAVGTVYIIFLANITETDFHIGFLYLTNASQPFLLRMFEYQGATVDALTFDGYQHLDSTMTTTSPVSMPKLQLEAKPQTRANALSAIGPKIYLDRSSGQVLNGSATLTIFPLLNQYFDGPSDYNELWALLTDNYGTYYFSILYFRNDDPNHVIMQHQLRLNDYRTVDGITLDASWSRGFTNILTVRVPASQELVRVDGFPFQTNGNGVTTVSLPNGPASIQVPDQISSSANTELHFQSWGKFGSANPLSIVVNSTLDLTANYKTQYQLKLRSEYGNVNGSGWYDKNTRANFTAASQIALDNGTRRVFDGWVGDYVSPSTQGWVIMNSSKLVTAIWKTLYDVKLELFGVPMNSTASVIVNNEHIIVNGSSARDVWVESNGQLTIEVQTTQIQEAYTNYNFTGLRADNQSLASTITVAKPITVQIVYSDQPKAQGAVSLNVFPSAVLQDNPFGITGSISHDGGSSKVLLFYSSDSNNWQQVATVNTGTDGRFAYTWQTSSSPGSYFIKAYWPGDARHTPASTVASVRVLEMPIPNLGGLAGPNVGKYLGVVTSFPVIAGLIALASSLLALGVMIGVTLPGGSAVLGYFIGSLIVGLVFVFPVSALIAMVRTARSHRSPRVVWLIPLITIWVGALTLVVWNGLLLFAQPLAQASEIILVFSNMLLIPVALSLILAKATVG
jgi:hypothetical protein